MSTDPVRSDLDDAICRVMRAVTLNSGHQATGSNVGVVCFWHKADMAIALNDVRFGGKADTTRT